MLYVKCHLISTRTAAASIIWLVQPKLIASLSYAFVLSLQDTFIKIQILPTSFLKTALIEVGSFIVVSA